MFARIRSKLRRLEDRGASAIEYGLMIAAIAAVIVGVVFALGVVVEGAFKKTCDTIAASPAGDGTTCPDATGAVPPPQAPAPAAP